MNREASTEDSARVEPEALPAGIHVAAGEGRLAGVLASRLEVKAGEEAGLGFGMFRSSFPPGTGMPFLHVHHRHDEAFYVVAGEVQFQLGAQDVTARAGSAVLVPAGVPHCFRNVGSEDVEWIVVGAPPSVVTGTVEVGQLKPGDVDGLAELMKRYDSELLERRPHWEPR